ncbi:hypothetical protein MBLNU459_g6341t1 [Dothideomycetes sp. NU459]
MAAPNPMHDRHDYGPSNISAKTYHIAGVLTTVYGLEELPNVQDVACLWLLHPRLQKHDIMAPVAAAAINAWNERLQKSRSQSASPAPKGLIAVSFDQRNHGTRQVDKLANESWKAGNPRHAPDMFSIFHGTAQDTSLLMDYLSSYIFPTNSHSLTSHLVLGVSLGGHAAWHCLLQEPRITAGIVVIGCPDYTRLMSQRARKSKLDSWKASHPPGRDFLGSKDFPKGLIEAVEKYDPAGLLLGELDTVTAQDHLHEPSDAEKTRLRPILRDRLGGKRILCLSGGADKLVPYSCSEPFMQWFKSALRKDGGWFNDRGVVFEDIVDEEAGHEYSAKMRAEATRFIIETLAEEGGVRAGSRSSKI